MDEMRKKGYKGPLPRFEMHRDRSEAFALLKLARTA
jgi:hypothetical protein